MPTLTASVAGISGELHDMRALLDYGSQTSFITEEVANALDCEVVCSNVDLRVRGFNESRHFNSNLIRFNMHIGHNIFGISALCIPSFPMSLELKGLDRVVEVFHSKGWKLADNLLGSDNSHILPVETMTFGTGCLDSHSCALKSELGIMLQGSIQQVLHNARYLPHNDIRVCAHTVQADLEDRELLLDMKIKSATSFELNEMLNKCLNLNDEPSEECSDQDKSLFNYIIENIERDESGRVIVPALWDRELEHLLAKNFDLANRVLQSTLRKFKNRPEALHQYDEVIGDQIREGVVEKIPDLEAFLLENPTASFLPHSAVMRESSSTTKCRVVFLSNLCERGGMSHNEVSFPGANLNQSLFTSLLLLRFNKYLLSFDLRKAFLMIKLRPEDSMKLLFLWFRDVQGGNYEVIALRFLRLGFGLRFSPSILVSVLYYILMVNVEKNEGDLCAVARRFYSMLYMDNVSYSSSKVEDIRYAFRKSFEIFNAYGFDLQKFLTNVPSIQDEADKEPGEVTPSGVDLFGMIWKRSSDHLLCRRLALNPDANTKRKILQTLNAQFDPMGLYLPLLNRAKFFLHALQLDGDIGWDTNIGPDRCREWERICKQLNAHDDFPIDRNVGDRTGTFCIVGFSDASKEGLGLVFYLWNKESNKMSFILAKSKVLGRQLKSKSIPVLELVALSWGAEVAVQLVSSLSNAVEPVEVSDVFMHTDSSISLSWLKARIFKTGKIERKSVLVNNKIQ